jgi:predicted transposase/invertase (TIGR01784 family)
MKRRADERNILATAEEKGLKKGIQQGMQQGIQQGMQQGIQQGMQQGIQQGIQQGKQQGKLEEKLQIARNLKASGVSIDIIKQSTNLTDEEILNL